jgi:hypothetical protein
MASRASGEPGSNKRRVTGMTAAIQYLIVVVVKN